MNKTFTVNIGGSVFHIDENAYYRLDQYLTAIRKSFSKEEGEEIVHDIEIRIAELLSENINDLHKVVTIEDVDRIIAIMGKPEDFIDDNASDGDQQEKTYTYIPEKKLYRDPENAVLGGVLAGLGHYLKIDTVWIRILFLILVLFFGTGVMLYIILWIVIPKAKTTTQILEMKREPVNISTIEKVVKDNFNYVSNKINEVDYEQIKKQTKIAGKTGGKWFRNIVGVLLIAISALILFGTILGLTATFMNKELITNQAIKNQIPLFMEYTYSTTTTFILFFLLSSLPFIGLLLIGLRLIYSNIKYVGFTIIALFIIWFASGILISIPLLNAKNYVELRDDHDLNLKNTDFGDFNFPTTDRINVQIVDAKYFDSDRTTTEGYEVMTNENIPVVVEIMPTYLPNIYGLTALETDITKLGVDKITVNTSLFQFEEQSQQLLISNVFTPSETYENLKAKYILYIPENHKIFISENIYPLLKDKDQFKPNHWYKLNENKVFVCEDCL